MIWKLPVNLPVGRPRNHWRDILSGLRMPGSPRRSWWVSLGKRCLGFFSWTWHKVEVLINPLYKHIATKINILETKATKRINRQHSSWMTEVLVQFWENGIMHPDSLKWFHQQPWLWKNLDTRISHTNMWSMKNHHNHTMEIVCIFRTTVSQVMRSLICS